LQAVCAQPRLRPAAVPVWQEIGWVFLIADPAARENDIAALARARLANDKVPNRALRHTAHRLATHLG
jgi:hypothetical protein